MPFNGKTATHVKQEPGLSKQPLLPLAIKIKQEPAGPAVVLKQERLTSFRAPRDLTLGGIPTSRANRGAANTNKKVYIPNLNAARNKNVDVKTSRDTSALGRGRGRGGERRTDSVRGRGAKTSSLVQTSGLFSEGTGEAKMRRSSSVFDRNSGAGDSASSLRRPTLVKRESKYDPAVEQKQIQEILGELDDEDRDILMEDPSYGFGIFRPIALHQVEADVKPNQRLNAPSESATSSSVSYPQSLEEFFSRQQQQLFLLQLPDSLPGHGPDEEPAESAAAENAASLNKDPSASYCTMRQLDDGMLGKIVRYKSGKTKLLIGDTRFDINLGMEPGLMQEIMSVRCDAKTHTGSLINLGQIQAKLNAIPDWEYIFASAEAAKAAKLRHKNSDLVS